MTTPQRYRVWLRRLLKALLFFLLGLILLVGLALLSVNIAPVSAMIASRVNAALEPSFKGRLVLHRLGHVDFGGILGAELEVRDPAGQSVLYARNIDVRLFWPGIVWDAVVTRPESLLIPIDRVALESVDVNVIDDGSGTPTLAQAFEPKEPPKEKSASTTELSIEDLLVENTRVRGALASVGAIDVDLGKLEASVTNGRTGTHLLLEHLDVNARQLPQIDTLTGGLTADITLPAEAALAAGAANGGRDSAAVSRPSTQVYALTPAPAPRRILGKFVGSLAGSTATVDLRMLGEAVELSFDAESLSPPTITKLVPTLSPRAPAALSAKIDGALDDLGFEARLRQEGAQVTTRGRVQKDERRSVIVARVDTSNVDVSALMAGSIATRLNLGADATFEFDEGGGKGSYKVVTGPSHVGVERLPRTTIDGKVVLPSEQPLSATGSVDIDEAGAPTHVDYDVRSGEAGTMAKISSATRINRPPRVSELTGIVATGNIDTRADFDSAADKLEVEVHVRLRDIQHPQLKAREFEASALARGSAKAPGIELLANLTGVTASHRAWSRVRVSARGTSERLALRARAWGDKPDLIELSATVLPNSDRLVRAPEIRIKDRAGKLVIRAAGVNFGGGKVHVDRLSLDGPGRANLSLWYGPSLTKLDLQTERLDTTALLRMFGVKTPVRGATVNLTAQFQNGKIPSGKLLLDVDDLAIGKLKHGKVNADLVFERGKLSGEADIELGRGAKTHLAIDGLKPPLGPITESSLEAMTGDISLEGEYDLSRLRSLLPLGGIESAEGQVRFDVVVKRSPAGGQAPIWRAHVQTKSLVLVGERPDAEQAQTAERARQTSPWTLRGIDFEVKAALENQEAKLEARVFDRRGNLLETEAEWKQVEGRADLMNPRRALLTAPFTAQVRVPPRRLKNLPAPIRPTDIDGTVSLRIDAKGTLAEPQLDARARVERFRPITEEKKLPGLDLELAANYAKAGGSVQFNAHDKRAAVLELASRWSGDVMAVKQIEGKSPVRAELELGLNEFPIDIVPELGNRHVRGKLSGKAQLLGLGKDARFALDLRTDELYIDRLLVDDVRATVSTEGSKLLVSTSVAGRGGRANAKASTGLVWGDRLVPVVDDQLEGSFQARELRLSALLPLVEGSLNELDGKLDADLRATIENGTPRLSGTASLKEGAVHLPTLGQRFQAISAKVVVSPDAISIDEVRARGISGGFEANAKAQLKGLTPVSANGQLSIRKDDKLPLTIEGEAVGDAWGRIDLSYQHDEASKTNNVKVSLEKFNLELPAAPPRGIQELDQAKHIRVGYWRRDREFVPIPLQPMEEPGAPSEYKTIVVVELGSMRIEKGTQANVGLGGRIQATLGDEVDVRGKIETRRGELDISGKKFDIERGSVTFTGGAPDNPIISAVARYDSPVGFTVYAEYTGTASHGKLQLRSEPPLSQDEILTLLLFGTPDGSFGAGSGDSLSTAVGVAGGTAAQGLNRAMSDLIDLDVSARVDTSTGAPRPELVLQLSSRVAARVTQALGEPSPGQSPDRTFLTVELRLASTWSLSTMIGDRGASALDLIWRRRY